MQVIILSGGAGSRLWPVSSQTKPKPFIKMQDGQTLMYKALMRACGVGSVDGIISVTNYNFVDLLKEEFKNIEPLNKRHIEAHFILEPFAKNTAAAIASAALYVRGIFGPDEIMLILPADHLISNEAAFQDAVSRAEIIAAKGKIVTFGIKPTYPEIGYGYIEMEKNNVKQFVEKPPLKEAKKYAKSRNFFWNSGVFCFTAQTIIEEIEKHFPKLLFAVKESTGPFGAGSNNYLELIPEKFALVPEASIDCAVMERSKKIKMIECDFGWSDVGSWNSISKLASTDSNGNSIKGNALIHKASDCHVESSDKQVMVIGANNLVVVNSKDGILVIDKDSMGDVKEAYKKLRNNY